MQSVSAGAATKNITSVVDIPLNDAILNYVNTTANPQRVRVLVTMSDLNVGSLLTFRVKVGPSAIFARPLNDLGGSFTTIDSTTAWQSGEVLLSASGGDFDTLEVDFGSDNGADSSIGFTTEIFNLDPTDADGRTNVGRILDTTVTLTNDNLDTNVTQIGGATPQSDIATETKQDLMQADVDSIETKIDAIPTGAGSPGIK